MDQKKSVLNLLQKINQQEQTALLGQIFVVPFVGNRKVKIKVQNLSYQLLVQGLPARFQGWGIIQIRSTTQADFLRSATLSERQQYLQKLLAARLILVKKTEDYWFGILYNPAGSPLQFEAQLPVFQVEKAEQFDTVLGRFDGQRFWFEKKDAAVNPAIATYLRQQLAQEKIKELTYPHLNQQQKQAFALATTQHQLALQLTFEQRVARAVQHSGGQFTDVNSVPESDNAVVRYRLGDRGYSALVNRHTFQVVSAGICLSGGDRNFDLTTLVDVVKEGTQQQVINIVPVTPRNSAAAAENENDENYDDD